MEFRFGHLLLDITDVRSCIIYYITGWYEFESLLALYKEEEHKALLDKGRFMITPRLFPVATNYIGLWKVLAGNNKTEGKKKPMENEHNSSFCPQILFIAFISTKIIHLWSVNLYEYKMKK